MTGLTIEIISPIAGRYGADHRGLSFTARVIAQLSGPSCANLLAEIAHGGRSSPRIEAGMLEPKPVTVTTFRDKSVERGAAKLAVDQGCGVVNDAGIRIALPIKASTKQEARPNASFVR